MAAAPLQYVGVFRNHDIADVVDKAKVLSLAAVQLHGNEDQLYIDTLREASASTRRHLEGFKCR